MNLKPGAFALILVGCAHDSDRQPSVELPAASASATGAASAAPAASAPASIGSATMEKDGTIVLMLRAEGNGAVGDAMLRYPKDHKDYQKILAHLGGLTPGQSKPVPPWPDDAR